MTAISTQGRGANGEFVTVYAVSYSNDGTNWFHYTDANNIIKVKTFCPIYLFSLNKVS